MLRERFLHRARSGVVGCPNTLDQLTITGVYNLTCFRDSSLDAFYTPKEVAKLLVDALSIDEPAIIADFSAGGGHLLLEAEERWPRATFVATDLARKAVLELSELRPHWMTGRCDFLSAHSRRSCGPLRRIRGRTSAVLLNPPFSSRGALRYKTVFDGHQVAASKAMVFLLNALDYVEEDGEIVALLPSGVLQNERDSAAWSLVERTFAWNCEERLARGRFPGCAAATCIIKIRRRTDASITSFGDSAEAACVGENLQIRLTRGRLPMFRVRPDASGPRLVHSSDLRAGGVVLNGNRGDISAPTISSPAVLLPRVGKPMAQKIATYFGDEPLAMSDCVIALECGSSDEALRIQQRLTDNFTVVEKQYQGTGAPFITLRRLTALLETLHIRQEV